MCDKRANNHAGVSNILSFHLLERTSQLRLEKMAIFGSEVVMMLYSLSLSVSGPVFAQLMGDRVCSVLLHFSPEVCGNLSDPRYIHQVWFLSYHFGVGLSLFVVGGLVESPRGRLTFTYH